jgi:hypothetical protein
LQTTDGGADQLLLVDLLQRRQHGHALHHQHVRVLGGGLPDDPDLLDHVGDVELAVHRFLRPVRVDEPGRGARGLGHHRQAAAAQRPGA